MSRIYKIEGRQTQPDNRKKLRVAAYARVSTDDEHQLSSEEAQEDYYRNLILGKPEWKFAGIYADRGMTGTSYVKRENFKRMLADCEAGKIDMVITKSISRFARNTVDTIRVVRKLKALGIGVRFEKENLWTLDAKGEFVLTLMASFAQEEARSLSENTAWGIRKRMADGKYWVAYTNFLGYGKGFVVEEDGAYIVKLIYKFFIAGYSPYKIGVLLSRNGFKTPAGKDRWYISSILSILQNEKYKGDALLQKEFVADHLTKRRVKNNGELKQYYVSNGHPPIIPPILFDYVQEIYKQRHETRYSGVSLMSSKLFCGKCGATYGPKPIHSTDKYRQNLWYCRNRFRSGNQCHSRYFREDQLPTLHGDTFRLAIRKHPIVRKKCIAVIKQIVMDEKRMEEIRKWIMRIPTEGLFTDIEEWAMLVERITVYDNKMVLHAFGGESITMNI